MIATLIVLIGGILLCCVIVRALYNLFKATLSLFKAFILVIEKTLIVGACVVMAYYATIYLLEGIKDGFDNTIEDVRGGIESYYSIEE